MRIKESKKIIARDKLLDLPIEEQRALMKEWRNNYSVAKICESSNIPKGGSFYNYLRYLGLPTDKDSRGTKKDRGISTMNYYEKKTKKRGQ